MKAFCVHAQKFLIVFWSSDAGFFSLQIEHFALRIAFCVQCYSVLSFPTAYFSVYGVNLFNILNRTEYLYLKVAEQVMCLALQQQTARIRLLKFV